MTDTLHHDGDPQEDPDDRPSEDGQETFGHLTPIAPQPTGVPPTAPTTAITSTGRSASVGPTEIEQAKAQPAVDRISRESWRQRLARRRLAALRTKGVKDVRLLILRSEARATATRALIGSGPTEAEARSLALPYWLPYPWIVLAIWVISRIEQRFVGFLPGFATNSVYVAVFLAATFEALAWWFGRALAASHEAVTAQQLKYSVRAAVYCAAPTVILIQGALFSLRLIRTGEVSASVALTLAALAVFAVSTWIHDASSSGVGELLRRLQRRSRVANRALVRAERSYAQHAGKHQRIMSVGLVQPAMGKVTRAVAVMTGTNTLVDLRAGEPKAWTITPLLENQISIAAGNVPAGLTFPAYPLGDLGAISELDPGRNTGGAS